MRCIPKTRSVLWCLILVASCNELMGQETQQQIEDKYRIFNPVTDTKSVDCTEVTGQFFFKVREQTKVTKLVPVKKPYWVTCWVYNPVTCQNEKVKYQAERTVDEPQQITEFEDVVYCAKVAIPVDIVKQGKKCDCDDLPEGATPSPDTLLPPATLFASVADRADFSDIMMGAEEISRTKVETTPAAVDKQTSETAASGPVQSVQSESDRLAPVESSPLPAMTSGLRVTQVSSPKDSCIWLQNDTDSRIWIRRLTFRPQTSFEISGQADTRSSDNDEVFEVQFSQMDNSSSSSKLHGTYARSVEGLWVAANKGLALRINIYNPRHRGWAFIGELQIEHDGGSLAVRGVQTRFQSSPIASIHAGYGYR